jgi:hypothetical protein
LGDQEITETSRSHREFRRSGRHAQGNQVSGVHREFRRSGEFTGSPGPKCFTGNERPGIEKKVMNEKPP